MNGVYAGVIFCKDRSRAQTSCKFWQAQFQKVPRRRQFLTILNSKWLSRVGVVQILSTSWAADPSHHLAFRTYLCEPSKPRNYGKTEDFAQFLVGCLLSLVDVGSVGCLLSLGLLLPRPIPSHHPFHGRCW